MTDDARAAGYRAYSNWYGQYTTGGVRQAFDSGYDSGVTEGTRQAREAVLARFEYEADRSRDSLSFNAGFLAALDAIDALGVTR